VMIERHSVSNLVQNLTRYNRPVRGGGVLLENKHVKQGWTDEVVVM
jgi:hypothetical protein